MADFRLDAYQNENSIKSSLAILQEENNTDKTIDEIKNTEGDFQTNLNLILNEYEKEQIDLNTRQEEPVNMELKLIL